MKKWMLFTLWLGWLLVFSPAQAQGADLPNLVIVPGTLQSELGCSADWQPDCEQTALVYDAEDDVWQATFLVTPGNDQDKKGSRYKVALDGSWSLNYGLHAVSGGADIPLLLTEPAEVKFYYDHKTHWITDNVNTVIAVALGNFQQALGCQHNDDPACLRSWLQDPDGDGLYTFSTRQLTAGVYSVAVALYEDAQQMAVQPVEFTVKKDFDEIYFGFNADRGELLISTEGAPRGDITARRAHWVSRETILWRVPGSPASHYRLHYAPQGGMSLSASGIEGAAGELTLTFQAAAPDEAGLLARFPHLRGLTALTLSQADLPRVPELLKGQVIVTAWNGQGKLTDASGLQIPGALDDLYRYDGPLGISWEDSQPVLRVWAPTAQRVRLLRFLDASSPAIETLPMAYDVASGVWSLSGQADWQGQFYLYEVQVYVPTTGRVETNQVTDPYSLSLSTNGRRSQIVNLDDPALKPPGWEALIKPPLAAPEDIVLYELHIRDFSAADPSVPEELRGTFKAFTLADSNGMRHLKRLAAAGLTHIHLLPAFDIASINEDKSAWQTVDEAALRELPGDSDQQQAAVGAIADADAFNWGYDPHHYTAPEGSYATDPNGAARVLEFREMVQALNQSGLRVVMDVVYNHTNASGQSANSVLDKIVPGYYHRLDANGLVEHSTCCENTASEHHMMEKLIIDSVLTWAEAYKVDGFRFDLMGHHLLSDMTDLRAALDALTPSETGLDGRQIYLYGEGWDFGEVVQNARGKNASQLNIGGTGIGVFNDRLRDAVRCGPFGALSEQCFITGLWFEPNQYEERSASQQRARLDEYRDWIRLGLAGNLADYTLTNAKGYQAPGRLIGYNGAPAGYTHDPQENVVYVSAHDNETLWDALQAKAPAAWTVAERVRMYNLGLNIVMLSQGVPFFHAGDELLRSKSLDRNSYNSGDWFNRLDYTYQTNNWAVGLPPSGDNADQWDLIRPLLANPQLQVSPADIQAALNNFETFLKIRKSSQLFRLQTADQVVARLSFVETEAEQTPGLLAYRLNNDGAERLEDPYRQILVAFNASPTWQTLSLEAAQGLDFGLHPALQSGNDDLVKQAAFERDGGLFKIPPRTTVVFVLNNPDWQAPGPEQTPSPAPSQPEENNPLPGLFLGGLALLLAALGAWWFNLRRKHV